MRSAMQTTLGLKAGDLVTVRSEAEIRATLDEEGALDGLPFMPEMRRYCGRKLRVYKRADRVCVEGESSLRRLRDTVFLDELRCDGGAHGGCQRGCLLFWKEAWLERAPRTAEPDPPLAEERPPVDPEAIGKRFSCQSTALAQASTPVPFWDPLQYTRDVATGNLTPVELLRSFAATLKNHLSGPIAPPDASSRTPSQSLGLEPGEWVEIRPLDEIRRTLDSENRNRGLELSPGMPERCGERHRVRRRVDAMIVETDGVMRRLKDTVVLDDVDCDGMCSRGCPRKNHLLWREIWLRRV